MLIGRTAQEHERRLLAAQCTHRVDIQAIGQDDDAVGLARAQYFEGLRDLVMVTLAAAHQHAVIVLVSHLQETAHDLREKSVLKVTAVDVRHDDRNGVGTLNAQGSGNGVRMKVERRRGRQDAFPGCRADLGFPGEDAAHGAGMYAGFLRHITDRGHRLK